MVYNYIRMITRNNNDMENANMNDSLLSHTQETIREKKNIIYAKCLENCYIFLHSFIIEEFT